VFRKLFSRKPDTTPIDGQITKVLSEMDTVEEVDSPEYKEMMKRLERLYKLQAQQRPKRISRETILIVAGNLVGILIIVAYEKNNVWTSKAIDRVRPVRET
jgi:tetrahydromethanopterin S-methyltransferase subunit G